MNVAEVRSQPPETAVCMWSTWHDRLTESIHLPFYSSSNL